MAAHIIQERIELEEAAFAGAKHDLATKGLMAENS